MKKFLQIIFHLFLFGWYAQAQNSKEQTNLDSAKPFQFSFSMYNHAELIYKGGISHYVISDSSLKVSKSSFFGKEVQIVFSGPVSKFSKSIIEISKTNFNSLDTFYCNWCVMITSGEEYDVTFKNDLSSKKMHLHHYYLVQLESIVKLINENLPEKYRIRYLTKDNKQDCTLSQIMH